MTKLFPGVVASGISGHLWAPSGAYEQIASTTVGAGGVSTVTFNGIPQTYQNLQIRALARTTVTADFDDFLAIRFNGDSSSNYVHHATYGLGSSAGSGVDRPITFAIAQRASTNKNTTGIFGAIVLDILDYANTNKNKVTRNIGGYDRGNGGQVYLDSNLWLSTSEIYSITITPSAGASMSFTEYSQFALYGTK